MAKIDKLLLLINLFHTRRSVTLKTIQSVCGIPERSAYRYLNTLSEANIPITYDRRARRYQLDRDANLAVENLDLNEKILLTAGLKMLSRVAGPSYNGDIRQLLTKLFVRAPFPLEEVWEAMDSQMDAALAEGKGDTFVSTALIYSAMLTNRTMQLVKDTDNGESESIQMHSPSLQFRNDWQVVDKTPTEGPSAAAIADVSKVVISQS